MIKKVDTVLCQVQNMDQAVAFYRDVLGLTPRHMTPYWSDFLLDGIVIGLHPPFQGSTPARGNGWILGLSTDDVLALKNVLVAAGGEVGGLHDVPGGAVLEFSDPDGNRIQAIQHDATVASLMAK
jgi:predicted enzyme related to lactoylglutathione lyase